jgi:hypothetical protein
VESELNIFGSIDLDWSGVFGDREEPERVVGQFENCIASAAKAGTEKKPFIAAVNRCATQKQGQFIVTVIV